MYDEILEVEISKVLSDLGPQIYELEFEGNNLAQENFASFAMLNFGKFQNQSKYFHDVRPDGKSLVLIHKCPKYRNKNKNAYYTWTPRKDTVKSCTNCNYRFNPITRVSAENEGESIQTEEKSMSSSEGSKYVAEDPLNILKVRLAKGEITQQEYQDLRKIIE